MSRNSKSWRRGCDLKDEDRETSIEDKEWWVLKRFWKVYRWLSWMDESNRNNGELYETLKSYKSQEDLERCGNKYMNDKWMHIHVKSCLNTSWADLWMSWVGLWMLCIDTYWSVRKGIQKNFLCADLYEHVSTHIGTILKNNKIIFYVVAYMRYESTYMVQNLKILTLVNL